MEETKMGKTKLDLLYYCERDNLKEVINLLNEKSNLDLNISDIYHWTPLLYAAENNNLEIVKLLIKNGADPRKEDAFDQNLICAAVKNENIEMVKLLMDNGADPQKKDAYDRTPVNLACRKNNLNILKYLIFDKKLKMLKKDFNLLREENKKMIKLEMISNKIKKESSFFNKDKIIIERILELAGLEKKPSFNLIEDSERIYYDIFEKQDELRQDMFYDFLYKNNNNFTKHIDWELLDYEPIKTMWLWYAKRGNIKDEEELYRIQEVMVNNTIKITIFTELLGHSSSSPEEYFEDAFKPIIENFISGKLRKRYDKNIINCFKKVISENEIESDEEAKEKLYENLKEKFFNYYSEDPNSGQSYISDYGLPQLEKLCVKLLEESIPETKLLIIDQMLNVVHQRSDLASWFVKGGTDALSEISGSVSTIEESFFLKEDYDVKKELEKMGAEIIGDKVRLYRGADIPAKEIKKLRYNDYLSVNKTGVDFYGKAGASLYGKNIVEFLIPIKFLKFTNGEIQYIGPSSYLKKNKYPLKIYKAYNDYYGSNYSSSQIDKMDFNHVRLVASMGLSAGKEEFDNIIIKKETKQ
jgi:hypothetical protein